MKRYFAEKFFGNSKIFPNYLTYTCVNGAFSDFIYKFVGAITFLVPAKGIRVKASPKPWFDNHIVLAIQRQDKLCKKYNFRFVRMHLPKMILM